MAEELGSLAVRIGLDSTGFQTGVTQVNKNLKVLNSEFKMNTAAIGANGKSLDLLKAKSENLTKVMGNQQLKLELLEKAYNQSVVSKGKDANATKELEARMNFAKASLDNMGNELDGTNKKIAVQSSSWTKLGKTFTDVGTKMKSVGETTTSVGKKLSVGITAPILGVGVAAVKIGMDFEASMSKVQAISGATGNTFKALNDQALQLGQDTAFSAKEAADGMENLASAGFSTTEIMQAMPGMLNLAASGGLAVADASDIASSALRGFGLDATQSGHVADVLAKAAADTNADVTGMGMALKYAAPPAKALGMSIEETSAAIGEMSNVGIKGEMAGTTLRSSLISLASPSKEAAKTMKDLGFNAFDAQGKMLPFSQVLAKLQTTTKGLTQEQKANALATIFGKESLSGMMALVDAGPVKFDKLTQSFKTSDGAAAAMAKTMQNNAKSSIEQMMGSLETAGIKIEQALAPSITKVALKVQDLANAFSNLSPKTQDLIIKTAIGVATIGPLLVGFGKLITAFGSINLLIGKAATLFGLGATATAEVGVAGVTATGGLAGLGTAFGAALLPLAPWIVGIGAAVGVGYLIKKSLSEEVIPQVNLFADAYTTTAVKVGTANNSLSTGYETTVIKISAGTKKAVSSYVELETGASASLNKLFINSTTITDKIVTGVSTKYNAMNVKVKAAIDTRFNTEYKTMQDFYNKSDVLSASDEAKELAKMKAKNTAKKAEEDKSTKAIIAIYQKAANEGRAISLADEEAIKAIQTRKTKTAVTALSKSESESKVILDRLKAYGTRVTAEQASAEIINANKSRDGTVKAANDQYTKTVASIKATVDQSTPQGKKLADSLIKDANRQRLMSIEQAEILRAGVVSKIMAMNTENEGKINTSTGKIITTWQRLQSWWDNWHPLSKSTTVTTNMVTKYTSTGTKMQQTKDRQNLSAWTLNTMDDNSSGTDNFQGGLTTMHEKGYEVYNLPGGSQIYNHEASVDMVAATSKAISSGVLASMSRLSVASTQSVATKSGATADTASSRVMATIGAYSMSELAKGIKDNVTIVEKAMANATKTIKGTDMKAKLDILFSQPLLALQSDMDRLAIDTGDLTKNLSNQKAALLDAQDQVTIYTAKWQQMGYQFGYSSAECLDARKELETTITTVAQMGQEVTNTTASIVAATATATEALSTGVNDMFANIKDALKQNYAAEQSMDEANINGKIEDNNTWKENSLATIDTIYNAKTSALDAESTAYDIANQDTEDSTNEAELRRKLAMHLGAAERKTVQAQLDALLKTNETRKYKESIAAQKATLATQNATDKAAIETVAATNATAYASQLESIKTFYTDKTTEANLDAEAQKMIVDNNQTEIVALLKAYGKDYEIVGASLGERLVAGFQDKLYGLADVLSGVFSNISTVSNIGQDTTTASTATLSSSSMDISNIVKSAINSVAIPSSNSTQTVIVPVYLDSKVIATVTAPYNDSISGSNLALTGRGL